MISPPTDTLLETASDKEVRRAAIALMSVALQTELSDLLADQRESRLTPEGRERLDNLMTEYGHGQIAKAKAMCEAARRGLG